MSNVSDFEKRRRDRRRRERLRKKRIRAALVLVAFICIIVLVCIGISTCTGENAENASSNGEVVETTSIPTAMPAVVSNIPPASENNNLMDIINNSTQQKRCYLTFDDGPTKNITPQILDILRRYNVKATFFQVGTLIDANPDMARRVYEEGHLIANHSNGHNYEKLYASPDAFINEINECYEKIKTITDGEEPMRLVRFPGGGFRSSADSYSSTKQECKTLLKENGFYFCDWNALNGDAEGRKKDADGLLEYLKDTINTDESAVILMHDASAKQATADSLAKCIEYLINQGYTFHRLDDIEYTPVTIVAPTASAVPEADSDEEDNDDANNESKQPTSTPAASKKNEESNNSDADADYSEDNSDDNSSSTDEPQKESNDNLTDTIERPTQAPLPSGVIVIN